MLVEPPRAQAKLEAAVRRAGREARQRELHSAAIEERRDAHAEDERPVRAPRRQALDLRELAAMSENDSREAGLLVPREAWHVGVRQDVRRMLVIRGVRDREANLVEPGRPCEHRVIAVARPLGEDAEQLERERLDALGL